MSLLGNYTVFAKSPASFRSGTTVSDMPSNYNKSGSMRNRSLSMSPYTAIPNGYTPPYCWSMAQKSGGMASYVRVLGDGDVTFANLAGGLNAVAPLSGSGDITNAALALIVSAVAAITGLGGLTADITGKLEATAALAGSGDLTAALGAIAEIVGALTGSGDLDGTMTAQASMSADINVTGDLLTTANVASAIWGALASAFNDPGTMGNALNSAGGAGDPWITNLPGSYVAGQAGYIVGNQILTEDDLTKIADIVLRRTTANVEASSNGDAVSIRSLYGMIAQGVHKTSISGTTLTVTKSDETTTLGTRTIATNPTAKPIISFDTD
jgi:hypothetical protein